MIETTVGDETEPDPRILRTRRRAIDATVSLLAESGLDGCTMQMIAERARVARSTLYRHWPDPSDLIVAALEEIAQPPEAPGPDTGTLEGDLLELALSLTLALVETDWGRVAPQLFAAAAISQSYADVLERFVSTRSAVAGELLGRARSRGELAAGFTDGDVLTLLMGPIYYRFHVLRQPVDEGWTRVHVGHVRQLVSGASSGAVAGGRE